MPQFPAYFTFNVPVPGAQPAAIWTHQLSIKNAGYRVAKSVEIIHAFRPPHFQIQPAVMYTEATNPAGQHVIQIPTLARREFLSIQIIAVGNAPPNLVSIRSEEGPSRFTQTGLHFVISKRRQLAMLFLLAVGLITTVYWIGRLVARYGPLLFAQ